MVKKFAQKAVAFAAVFLLIISLCPLSMLVSAETNWSAEGYQPISSAADLDKLVRTKLDGKFYLTQDIVFTEADFKEKGAYYNNGVLWIPLGPTYSERFTGILDGNGHTISGLQVAVHSGNGDSAYAGLFGYSSGKILNLRMLNPTVKVTDSSYAYAGGLVGAASGTIQNCYVLGGKVRIENTKVVANAGGIVGRMYAGNLKECYNGATVYASGTMAVAGGIAAQNNATIEVVANQGNISSKAAKGDAYAGGVVGINDKSVLNGLNRGAVEVTAGADGYGGGLTAANRNLIQSVVNIGAVKITAKSHLFGGAIAGQSEGGLYKEAYYLDKSYDIPATESTLAATKLTSAQMGKKEQFPTLDFNEVWTISKSAPMLKKLQSVQNVLTGIKITKQPKTVAFNEGQEFDPTGMQVTAYYEDGTNKVLTTADYVVTGYNSQTPGKKTLTISYNGYTATLTVTVRQKVLESISIETLPRVVFGLGEKLDVSGGILLAHYDNGATTRYTMHEDMITGFDNTKLGKQTLTLSFGGKKATFEITVQKEAPPTTTTTTMPTQQIVTGTLPSSNSALDGTDDPFDEGGNISPNGEGEIQIDKPDENKPEVPESDPVSIWVAIVIAVAAVIAAGVVGFILLKKSGRPLLHPDARHNKQTPATADEQPQEEAHAEESVDDSADTNSDAEQE